MGPLCFKENNNDAYRVFDLHKYASYIALFFGIMFSIFHLVMGFRLILDEFRLRSVHLSLVLLLAFILLPFKKKQKRTNLTLAIDILLGLLAAAAAFYTFTQYLTLYEKAGMPLEGLDLFFGITLVILLIEATRRKIGIALPLISIIFILYAYFGQHLPTIIAHQGYNTSQIVNHLYFTVDGIFGIPLGASAKYIVLFILLGEFLQATNGGKFFIDLAFSIVGKTRGGPAKAGVIASGFFGSISGSAVANVMTTGQITIPLMKRVGYTPAFAGAVEAVASSGGQLMPPVMGAAAFIMAEILGVTYWSVCIAALIPAILFYISLIISVDLEAAKCGMKRTDSADLPRFGETLRKGWKFLLPLFLLVIMLGMQYSPQKSVVWAIALMILVSVFSRKDRLTIKGFINALRAGAETSLEVALVCACVGIIIGTFMLTGLGLKLSGILVQLAGGSMLLLLILTMLCSLVLGMGMPTSAAYLTLAILVAPALIKMGVTPIGAHMFVFYFGIFSAITPPVALAAYAGAALAQADFNKTGWIALRLGIIGFIVPYIMAFSPALNIQGSTFDICSAIISALLGVYLLGVGLQRFLLIKIGIIESVLFIGTALLLIVPEIKTDLIGYGLAVILFIVHVFKWGNENKKKMD